MGISLSGLASGMDTESMITEMMKAQNTRVDKLTKAKNKIEMRKEVWSTVNSKILKFYNGTLNNLKMQGTFLSKKVNVLNPGVGTATATITAANGTHDFTIDKLAKSSGITSSTAILKDGVNAAGSTTLVDLGIDADTKFIKIQSTVNGEEKVINIEATDTLSSLASKIAAADTNLIVSYEASYGRMIIKTKDTGVDKQVTLTALKSDAVDVDGKYTDINTTTNIFEKLNMGTATNGAIVAGLGQDAEFTYNGVTGLKSKSNQIEIGGIKLDAYATGSTSIIVASNTEEVYKAVKDFVKEYNEILTELNSRAYSGVAKGYEPLTKEEKSSMSEADIKLWEDTVKSGLLNRDSTAIELIDVMRNVMTANSGVDTSKMKAPYTLITSLGIDTFTYQEKGALHIGGDSEDPIGAMNEDKLTKAINEDPEAVMNLLNGLGKALSDQLGAKMSSVVNVKSAFTFYNDKQIDKEIESKAEDITKMQERLAMVERRYRSQFSAMEQAMTKSNATSSWLTQMLG
ncbi:MAG: Flagellar hook-associated protein 2 [Clostridiales bacterium]|jgi:flagellar hook-associated protein 2|nr:Flagellar hook-associated protein 2 [Clostridiales bacterium]